MRLLPSMFHHKNFYRVLILILLEMRLLHTTETHRLILTSHSLNPYSTGNEVVAFYEITAYTILVDGLNPYSTGNEVVASRLHSSEQKTFVSLNPYSTGNEVVAQRKYLLEKAGVQHVLILILLEMRLLLTSHWDSGWVTVAVLILILLEMGLLHSAKNIHSTR